MSDERQPSDSSDRDWRVVDQPALGRLARLCLKELREILRDRRTMFTLVLMPLLVYPLLALVFQKFLLTSLTVGGPVEYYIGFPSEEVGRQLVSVLARGDKLIRADSPPVERTTASSPAPSLGMQKSDLTLDQLRWMQVSAANAEAEVEAGLLSLAIVPSQAADSGKGNRLPSLMEHQLVYRPGSPSSEAVLEFVEQRLDAVNQDFLRDRLQQLGVEVKVPVGVSRRAVDVGDAPPFSLAALLPLILVLMTVTGAVYPAIDLTAGERERGTLEALIAAPVPRVGLLLAKYVAVLTVAVLTALINLLGMTITARSTGLDTVLLGGGGLAVGVMLKVLALLILFAAFFSALLLALTSYARSFKEAQAYIIPLMLLCLVPGIACLMPDLELTGLLAVTPLLNIVLLARDLLEGDVEPTLAAAAVVSTALYVFGAISLAAKIFGTDAILNGGQATWSDLFRRPQRPQQAVSMTAALGSLALLFPAYFVMSNVIARTSDRSIDMRLVLCGLVTVLLFAGWPLLVASLCRADLRQALRLKWAKPVSLVAAVLLGLSLWPLAYEVVIWQTQLGLQGIRADQVASVKELVDQWQQVSPVLVLLTLAVAPGVCEELFFRGFLLTALRNVMPSLQAIVAAAALFGVFHVVSAGILAPERFLPSTFLGLVLGYVCYRTGSVLPSMLLHVLHNGLLLMLAYYRDQLIGWGFDSSEASHLPMSWLALSMVGILAGGGLLWLRAGGVGSVASLPATPHASSQ